MTVALAASHPCMLREGLVSRRLAKGEDMSTTGVDGSTSPIKWRPRAHITVWLTLAKTSADGRKAMCTCETSSNATRLSSLVGTSADPSGPEGVESSYSLGKNDKVPDISYVHLQARRLPILRCCYLPAYTSVLIIRVIALQLNFSQLQVNLQIRMPLDPRKQMTRPRSPLCSSLLPVDLCQLEWCGDLDHTSIRTPP